MHRFVSFLLIFLLCITPVSAHSGRTDSDGGHYNSKTGEYHYHHGYSAHQHTDLNGDGKPDCPYDFKDLTGINSGSYSTRSSSSSKPVQKKSSDNKGAANMIGWIVSGILVLCLFFSSRSHQRDSDSQSDVICQKEKKVKELQTRIQELDNALRSLVESKSQSVEESQRLSLDLRKALKECNAKTEENRRITASFQSQIEEMEKELKSSEDSRLQSEAESEKLRSELRKEQEQRAALQSEIDHILSISAPSENETLEDRNAALAAQIVQKDNLIHDQAAQIQKMAEKLDKYTQVPRGVFYGDDGLPIYYKAASKKYGDYTAYLNRRTGIYHLDPKCAPPDAKEMHLFNIPYIANPCSKCASKEKRNLPVLHRRS